ncbi:amidase [Rhodospirillum sp. A1_3_36]|uniref:amidase n=1 Tax=Rhodospirillum sp. A1_3_36 TaxID=3391666 RepID=UPI0039A66B76
MTDRTDPLSLSAMEARRLIGRRALSPVELAEAAIARVEAVNPAVNALVAHDFDRVMTDARKAEEQVMAGEPLGPLHGLPLGVKDMVDVAGLPTTYGSELFADNWVTRDDPMVAALKQAGAVVLGKTNNPEWSAGGNTRNRVYGATANPHDLTKTCAGSSGGSAVTLATGMTMLSTGSDTGGSLRNPAAFCGVVGFRPSPGVVPGDGRGVALIPLPTNGPMARTVADTALMLSVQMRADPLDPWTSLVEGRLHGDPKDFKRLPRVDLSSLRVAVTEDLGFAPTERVIRDSFQDKLALFSSAFGEVAQDHPDCDEADRAFSVLRAVSFLSQHHRRVLDHPDKVGPNVRDNVEEGLGYSALDVTEALLIQGRLYRNWQGFFAAHDVVLAPAVTLSPRDWHELYPADIDGVPTKSYYHWLAMAYAATLAGHPSVTIPAGRDRLGLPFGLQIIGPKGGDLKTLAVAAELEALFSGVEALQPPRVDLEMLRSAPPLREAPGFMGFA